MSIIIRGSTFIEKKIENDIYRHIYANTIILIVI